MSVSVQLGLLMIALGLLPASLGGLIFLRRFRFLHTTYTTSGMVDGYAYQPKITFTTQTGEKVVLTSVGMSNPPRLRVGQEVPVVYDPSNPHKARIRSFASVWFASLLFGGLGSLYYSFDAHAHQQKLTRAEIRKSRCLFSPVCFQARLTE